MAQKSFFQVFSIFFSLLFSSITSADDFSTPEIIRQHGYPAEVHTIQSEDGYLIQYHRIPYGKSGPKPKKPYPILLHHGLLAASNDWIIGGPEKSLGYLLADEGYDVWMANSRGNTYSKSHISKNSENEEFWNFSFHEMGVYDLPAAVDYILNITSSEKLIYIGHSLGNAIFYAFSSTRPEYNDKILIHVGLAPVATLSHTASHLIKFIGDQAATIASLFKWFTRGSFLGQYNRSSQYYYLSELLNHEFTREMYRLLYDGDTHHLNQTLLSELKSYFPAGTSCKNIRHCSQLMHLKQFSQYDYSTEENYEIYQSERPPAYDLNKITVPVKFYYGENDLLVTPEDVWLLYEKLPKPMGCVRIDHKKWNHQDFFLANDVNELFNDQLLLFIKTVTDTPDFITKTVDITLKKRMKKLNSLN